MKRNRILMLLGDLGILAAALLIPLIAKWMLDTGPACVFTRFGVLCPSCGATRCVLYFFTGKFSAAFAMNPFAFCMIVYAIVGWTMLNLSVFTRWRFPAAAVKFMLKPATIIALAIGYAIFGVLRNFV